MDDKDNKKDKLEGHQIIATPEQASEVAVVLTKLLMGVNPAIDGVVCHDILMLMLEEGLDHDNATEWGLTINATMHTVKSKDKH